MNTASPTSRRQTLRLLASATALAALGNAHAAADDWPQRTVRVLVPYPAGGVTDAVARLLAERLGPVLGQPLVVDNKGGAGGSIGMDTVAKSAPDGHTLAFATISPLTLSPYFMKVAYDPFKDFIPVTSVMYSPVYVLATESFKGKNFADALALAKSQSNGVTIAFSGYGSVGHIMIEQLRRQSGANFVPVPYKGGNQPITDAVGAQFDLMTINPSDAVNAMIQKGRLRVLAVSAPERLSALPDTPTLAELGYKPANLVSLFGFFVPAGTPPAIVERLSAEVNKLLAQPEMAERLRKLDNVVSTGTPEQFASIIRAEHEANGKIIREANIKAE